MKPRETPPTEGLVAVVWHALFAFFIIVFGALWDALLIAVDLLLLLFKPRPDRLRHETFVIVRIDWENQDVALWPDHITKSIVPVLNGLRGVNEVSLIPILKPVESEIKLLLDLCRRHVGIRLDVNVK